MPFKINTDKDQAGFVFEYVMNDPYGLRIYTLKNGLKVYLSKNNEKPRIKSRIIVRAGSVNDPEDSTGMAHYLEHMMFKGTSSIGALDYENEKIQLNELSDLYEDLNRAESEKEKNEILEKIDILSVSLSTKAIPGELDRIYTHIGARYTNAYTGFEETVYKNDIPNGELERWLEIEKDRFTNSILRFFPTELEVVYEEYNQEQDDDFQKVSNLLMSSLFPEHPYGSRTILGKGEHLKKPSLKKLKEFQEKWYVPSNMAIAISGDLQFDKTIDLINRIWGDIPPGTIPDLEKITEEEIHGPIKKTIYGPDASFSTIGYRFDGVGSEDELYLILIDMMLSNSQAGLFDLNLVQNQKLLEAGTSFSSCRDYSWFLMYGLPRNNQTLDNVAVLLLEQIEKLKQGDFEDWMIDSVANYFEISRIQDLESNMIADTFSDIFISRMGWDTFLNRIENIRSINKENLVNFVRTKFKDNFVLIQKKKGKEKIPELMEKPSLSPLKIQYGEESDFYKKLKNQKSVRIRPEFVDFDKAIIKKTTSQGLIINTIENKANDLFEFQYIFDIGRNHSKKLALAAAYLNYIGTSLYSPSRLQQECFRLGLEMGVNTDSNRTYIFLFGRDRYFEKGVDLLEHLISRAKADKKIYKKFIKGILKKRKDAKLSKRTILNGAMYAWGKYGSDSPFTDILSASELKSISPFELTSIIKDFYRYKHRVFYYGPRKCRNIDAIVEQRHRMNNLPDSPPKEKLYKELESHTNRVFFVNYDMAQAEVLLISKQRKFQEELIAMAYVFNEFYGSGMNSIVFQEIREARGLAYSAYSAFTTPGRLDKSHYIHAFIGTQVNKLEDALGAMFGLMNDIPEAEISFEAAKESILKNLETERIMNNELFWTYLENNDIGIHHDYREDLYNRIKRMTFEEVKDFFASNIKGKKFTVLVLGNRKEIDFESLENYGEVTELKLKDIFNY
ncbi:MAG: insulinase family protein [Spirochaetaceae bacterium]|nr:insulinase family protein [Spirochaetaceae bacterium]